MKNKVITVFGAGFIGKNLIYQLLEMGSIVRVVSRNPYLQGNLGPMGNAGNLDLCYGNIVQEKTKFIYQLLQLKSIARIDFMVVNDIPYVIEVNITPGFAPASIAPQMISCAEKSIKEFWTEIVEEELKN